MSDLAKRLQSARALEITNPVDVHAYVRENYQIRQEAAARILELEAGVKKLKEALKPLGDVSPDTHCNDGQFLERAREDALACGINLRVSDIRRAAALGEKP